MISPFVLFIVGVIWFAYLCHKDGKVIQAKGIAKATKDLERHHAQEARKAKRMANLRY